MELLGNFKETIRSYHKMYSKEEKETLSNLFKEQIKNEILINSTCEDNPYYLL
jgi:hypothetical protein